METIWDSSWTLEHLANHISEVLSNPCEYYALLPEELTSVVSIWSETLNETLLAYPNIALMSFEEFGAIVWTALHHQLTDCSKVEQMHINTMAAFIGNRSMFDSYARQYTLEFARPI
jgi:hypothetical protein